MHTLFGQLSLLCFSSLVERGDKISEDMTVLSGEGGVKDEGEPKEKLTFRQKICHFMERPGFHKTILVFVIGDLLLTFVELVIGGYSCHGGPYPTLEKCEAVVGYLSFSILSIFVVEVVVRVVAKGPLGFLHQKINILDFLVIFSSFGAEMALHYGHQVYEWEKRKQHPTHPPDEAQRMINNGTLEEGEEESPTSMAILRIFQILRMLHAVLHGIEMRAHAQIEQIAIAKQEVEDETDLLKLKIVSLTHQLKRKRLSIAYEEEEEEEEEEEKVEEDTEGK